MRTTGTRVKFRASVQMGRCSGGADEGGRNWRLTVEDDTSGMEVLELYISDAELGAILGTSHTDLKADATVYQGDRIGKVREHKMEVFDDPAKGDYSRRADTKRIAHAESLESDGWVYTGNHTSQGFVKDGKVHAKYMRWVDKSPP